LQFRFFSPLFSKSVLSRDVCGPFSIVFHLQFLFFLTFSKSVLSRDVGGPFFNDQQRTMGSADCRSS
jgi:hypothetical protein